MKENDVSLNEELNKTVSQPVFSNVIEENKEDFAQKNVALLLGRDSVPERNAQPSRET